MNLFDYTSGKIKLVANVYFWIVSILTTLALIAGFVIGIVNDMLLMAFICLFMIPVSVLLFWCVSLFIYGFGRLIDNTDEIRYRIEHLENKNNQEN